jgi:hypothetical protein
VVYVALQVLLCPDIPSAEQNYFASLFLVTLGLSEFSEMQPVWTLIGLDKIGAAIWQHS